MNAGRFWQTVKNVFAVVGAAALAVMAVLASSLRRAAIAGRLATGARERTDDARRALDAAGDAVERAGDRIDESEDAVIRSEEIAGELQRGVVEARSIVERIRRRAEKAHDAEERGDSDGRR